MNEVFRFCNTWKLPHSVLAYFEHANIAALRINGVLHWLFPKEILMDSQQVLHLIHPVLRRRIHILWGTFKNKFPICERLKDFPNFEISKTVCKIMALISTLKAFSHLKLVNNCRASDKITTFLIDIASKQNLQTCQFVLMNQKWNHWTRFVAGGGFSHA